MRRNEEEQDVYIIPQNFIEGGKVFGGMFRWRNVVEAAILGLATGFPLFHLPIRLYYRIFLPGLLPKKKAGSCAFLTGPLSAALTEYGKGRPIRRLRRAVVCFRHLYSAGLPERMVRDHATIEVKQVLDVIADHFLVDDNGLLCTNLYTSAMGDREGTEVYVMAPEHLGEWLNLHPIKTP